MILECEKQNGCWANIGSPDFVPKRQSRGYLVNPEAGSLCSNGVKKNGLRMLWDCSSQFLRSERTAGQGFALWGEANLSGRQYPPGYVPEERESETRKTAVAGGQYFLYQAVRSFCWAEVPYDKFHVMRHLGEALDRVRKQEYARLSGENRKYIKGQKWVLLSNRENLTLDGKASLRALLKANKRLQTAYLLKESFGQLWSYQTDGWARRFFENWKESLKWQRLKPYEEFAKLIERHWDGIAAYSKPENKVSLGFVEGLNNKIRVIQRRAYGLRDEDYLRLKVLTCMLEAI